MFCISASIPLERAIKGCICSYCSVAHASLAMSSSVFFLNIESGDFLQRLN